MDGRCQPGTPPDCDDGVPCTSDSCNEAMQTCNNTPTNTACNDGRYCNGVETCHAAAGCLSGTPVNCNDDIACTADACDEFHDRCDNVPFDAACDDGVFCNGAEFCDVGSGCSAGSDPCPGQFCNEGTETCFDCFVDGDCPSGSSCNVGFCEPPCTISETAELTPSEPVVFGQFGTAVSVSWDTILIGASPLSGIGSGHVFRLDSETSEWTEAAQLTTLGGRFGDAFGSSVAIDGDVVVVGAWSTDTYDNPPFFNPFNIGAAYVFVRPPGSWVGDITETASLRTSVPLNEEDRFGSSVSIDGDVIVVAAPRNHQPSGFPGKVYIYVKPSGGWGDMTETAVFSGFGSFGQSVSNSGDVVVVGAPGSDAGGSNWGAVHVYRLMSGQWSEEGTPLTASDGAPGDGFGSSVSVSGNVCLVGAWANDGGGSAYFFRYNKTTGNWDEQKVTASDAAEGDGFGHSVSIRGNVGVIGAFNNEVGGIRSGSAYVLRFDGTTWVEVGKLTPSDGVGGEWFGVSAGTNGELAVIGAFWHNEGAVRSGSAYVFSDLSDCNVNDTLDVCDIGAGISQDCNDTGIPDECETDCNENGVADECDVARGSSQDCNANEIPDECESPPLMVLSGELEPIGDGVSQKLIITDPPLAGNDVLIWLFAFADLGSPLEYLDVLVNDAFVGRLFEQGANDCAAELDVGALVVEAADYNTLVEGQDAVITVITVVASEAVDPNPALCDSFVFVGVTYPELLGGDCDGDGVLDECELGVGLVDDCNGDDVPDDCNIAAGTSQDCNGNGIPDECDIADGTSLDCDGNGVPDECQADCDNDGTPDVCELPPFGTSEDCNGNLIPDECESIDVGDCDCSGDVDLYDYWEFQQTCFTGPKEAPNFPGLPPGCECFDLDEDGDVDLLDWGLFQDAFTGPNP
ncbi:MAG: FG-GAP repeat protein [Phycisphaerae bacterium]